MVNYILSTLICMIYHPPLRLTFGLLDLMLNHPDGRPSIMFLSVISTFCLTLPSDPPSRRTPLRLANDSCQISSFGTLTLSVYSMHGTHKKWPTLMLQAGHPLYYMVVNSILNLFRIHILHPIGNSTICHCPLWILL